VHSTSRLTYANGTRLTRPRRLAVYGMQGVTHRIRGRIPGIDWGSDMDMDYARYDNSARPAVRNNVGRMRRPGH
jgi:hypothetical protein